jgi:NADPH:quinone reductase-like Zn-dependent oxidoreductase
VLSATGSVRILDCMLMKAVVCEQYGPPEVLEVREVQRPEPKDDEVLVAVGATTVTSACGMMRRGDTLMARLLLGLLRPRRRFRIIGIEIAGTVERVGRRVTRFRPGDRVFGFMGFAVGGYAQFVCMRETASLAHAPAGLTDHEACTLVDGPTTALYFLRERGGLAAGERVAIVGASGSIGTAAVQLARHFGAEVTAVCSGANAELVRSLGAHHVVDYTQQDYSALGERFDVVFDTVGKSSFAAAKRCLVPGGRYLITVGGLSIPLRSAWSRCFGSRRLVFGMSIDKRESLRVVSELAARGALRPVIDRRYQLHGIAEAHRYVETGRKRGNVVIALGEC